MHGPRRGRRDDSRDARLGRRPIPSRSGAARQDELDDAGSLLAEGLAALRLDLLDVERRKTQPPATLPEPRHVQREIAHTSTDGSHRLEQAVAIVQAAVVCGDTAGVDSVDETAAH